MPIKLYEENGGKLLAIHVTGNLVKQDYEGFVPVFERLVRAHGKLRVLFDLSGFLGWKEGSFWDEIKFDLKHFSDIDRLAMVGDNKWQEGLATFSKPFTQATVRYFDVAKAEDAFRWLKENMPGDSR